MFYNRYDIRVVLFYVKNKTNKYLVVTWIFSNLSNLTLLTLLYTYFFYITIVIIFMF